MCRIFKTPTILDKFRPLQDLLYINPPETRYYHQLVKKQPKYIILS